MSVIGNSSQFTTSSWRSAFVAHGRSRTGIGAIYMDNRFQTSAFNEDDSIQMQAFAGQAAIALDTARLLERMESAHGALEEARKEVEHLNAQLKEELDQRTEELSLPRIGSSSSSDVNSRQNTNMTRSSGPRRPRKSLQNHGSHTDNAISF